MEKKTKVPGKKVVFPKKRIAMGYPKKRGGLTGEILEHYFTIDAKIEMKG